jgi:S1-C subfamily serine protease
MIDRVMPAIVLIETTGGRGSGFFVARDTLITNVHVVRNDSYVTLRRMDGSTLNARVDTRAPAFDIAVLKVAQPSPSQAVIPMASAHSLKPGQEIIVIGSALGTLTNSVSRGIVSGLRTSNGATLVQTDAATNPGNSGGPMLDRNGNVIGITTMGYKNAEGLNFGVAIDHARDLLEGRQTNLGSTTGLTEIQSQARGSESERLQQQGEQQFRSQIGQLAEAAQRIDAGWQNYRKQCYQGAIAGSYDREWFAMVVPGGMPANASAGCTAYYSQMQSAIREFKSLMQRATSDARRANVLPGTIRDTLRDNRLDFEWDR